MSKLKRYFIPGQTYFVTAVFHRRKRIPSSLFASPYQSMIRMAEKYDSLISAWVILPDHIHFLVTPPANILDRLIHDMKLSFGATYRKILKISSGRFWQRRYWDHVIRDQADMNRHIDYIHYNPVKHGYVRNPFGWSYSSIHDFRKAGYYSAEWGTGMEVVFAGEYGE